MVSVKTNSLQSSESNYAPQYHFPHFNKFFLRTQEVDAPPVYKKFKTNAENQITINNSQYTQSQNLKHLSKRKNFQYTAKNYHVEKSKANHFNNSVGSEPGSSQAQSNHKSDFLRSINDNYKSLNNTLSYPGDNKFNRSSKRTKSPPQNSNERNISQERNSNSFNFNRTYQNNVFREGFTINSKWNNGPHHQNYKSENINSGLSFTKNNFQQNRTKTSPQHEFNTRIINTGYCDPVIQKNLELQLNSRLSTASYIRNKSPKFENAIIPILPIVFFSQSNIDN